MILTGFSGQDNLLALKREFGPKLKHFMIGFQADSSEHADEILRMMEV